MLLNIKKAQTVFIYFTVILLTIFVFTANGHTQNFAGYDPAQSEKNLDDADFSQEEIEQILIDEGIPINPGVDLNVADQLESNSTYTLGANDIIEISVLRHPEVSGQFTINQEGKIQYEFVGDIEIAGLKKDEVNTLLTEKLSKYIISPELTIKIIGYNSKVVYVIGEVGRPGKIFMRGDTITTREALIQAALPLLSARTGKTKLITPSSNGKPKVQNVNIAKLLYEGDLRENFVMKPGDTLYVPATVMAKALRVIQPVAAPVGSASGLGRTMTTGF